MYFSVASQNQTGAGCSLCDAVAAFVTQLKRSMTYRGRGRLWSLHDASLCLREDLSALALRTVSFTSGSATQLRLTLLFRCFWDPPSEVTTLFTGAVSSRQGPGSGKLSVIAQVHFHPTLQKPPASNAQHASTWPSMCYSRLKRAYEPHRHTQSETKADKTTFSPDLSYPVAKTDTRWRQLVETNQKHRNMYINCTYISVLGFWLHASEWDPSRSPCDIS